jgi:hypothetical protein
MFVYLFVCSFVPECVWGQHVVWRSGLDDLLPGVGRARDHETERKVPLYNKREKRIMKKEKE